MKKLDSVSANKADTLLKNTGYVYSTENTFFLDHFGQLFATALRTHSADGSQACIAFGVIRLDINGPYPVNEFQVLCE